VDAAQVFPSIIKTDLHACVLHIFAAILKTGACQATVIPRALPIFKRFVTSISQHAEQGSDTSKQLRATLMRFLQILKHAQQREFDAALACEKNTILTTTILLSSASSVFTVDDPLVKRFVDELFDCLGNRMTSKVAAGCCRSLLLLPKKSSFETSIASQLLPQLLSFLANPSNIEGLDESRSAVALSLVAFITATLATAQQRLLAAKMIVPALLGRAQKEPSTGQETSARLLEIATADQAAFRDVVGGLGSGDRGFLEEVLRRGQGAGGGTKKVDGEEEPRIALRMDFG